MSNDDYNQGFDRIVVMITTTVRGIPILPEDIIEGELDWKSYIVTKRVITIHEELLKPIGRVSSSLLALVLEQVKENF